MNTIPKIIKPLVHLSFYKVYCLLFKKKPKTKVEVKLKNDLKIGKSDKYDLIFLHNPKAAGNSLMEVLKIPLFYNHQLPYLRFNKQEWENNKFLLAVRHPIDRLVSSFYFHTGDFYQGVFMKLFPNLKNITSLYDYFKYFSAIENTITPQYNYTYLPGSDKNIDIIIKFENLEEDLYKYLSINTKLPKKNISKRIKKPTLSKEQLKIILSYYDEDFKMFNYSKKDYHKFVEII